MYQHKNKSKYVRSSFLSDEVLGQGNPCSCSHRSCDHFCTVVPRSKRLDAVQKPSENIEIAQQSQVDDTVQELFESAEIAQPTVSQEPPYRMKTNWNIHDPLDFPDKCMGLHRKQLRVQPAPHADSSAPPTAALVGTCTCPARSSAPPTAAQVGACTCAAGSAASPPAAGVGTCACAACFAAPAAAPPAPRTPVSCCAGDHRTCRRRVDILPPSLYV
eukprot:5147450-Pleurochrysis_carterae.AAC.2